MGLEHYPLKAESLDGLQMRLVEECAEVIVAYTKAFEWFAGVDANKAAMPLYGEAA